MWPENLAQGISPTMRYELAGEGVLHPVQRARGAMDSALKRFLVGAPQGLCSVDRRLSAECKWA
jgi:hypothetical protein